MRLIQFADGITEREHAILKSKSGRLVGVTGCASLIWTIDQPEPRRRCFILRNSSDRDEVFAQIRESDLEQTSEDDLHAMIIGSATPRS